ncbi:MAG: DUF2080 family transposase-associated protein [Candidatus Diapherotrites archaeon]|nr:DUF2080 family transposase-associated protein [Candidatus Diapherotrites archaeon]
MGNALKSPKKVYLTLTPKDVYSATAKPSGSRASRVYLPPGWEGKRVYVILL